ncbi:MAG: Sugar kinase, ribokinase family [Parcubacteria group bacterium GW2011_GWC1_43_11b]|uniref:Carbohydrate kinase PfkB domain-containing protein n=2 Tax=Candidatus Vogeliibacteriota TaxID=1817922 RepID=A0A1G2QEZ2_9BACT|nr:MAG: Sugar kinase, ribokinase family [Parcubacteria group bacterium GW2011_GWB1_42_9]KKS88246.1 MAG: Sugar kinase, ribokinase family [Parcubacteria group bacterium GW2011_GWC1_43_11b]OHA59175.1 MAG: hypothetical protein A2370_03245 [Candidatus Vogelbacteria bacterium RIFOXYB1_FULL_42_16]OHA60294.1 MAG: hypothetical protein A2607_01610 [Candidatus Vogelbacteria bacterium RIFOXYD1_FULL_42_15]
MSNFFSKIFSQPFDLITIGDLTTDAFIHLHEGKIRKNSTGPELCLRFGDKIPYESVTIIPAVGNSANVAVATARLGLRTALITDIGADGYGQRAMLTLKQNRVVTKFIKIHKNLSTNFHFVLWRNDDRTILVRHEKFPYQLPTTPAPRWLYLSSLGPDSLTFHSQIVDYLKNHSTVKLAFQPGTYQIKLGVKKLAPIYRRTEILFCNRDEAKRILKTKNDNIKKLLTTLRELGPKIAIITDGKKGAYVQNKLGQNFFIPIFPDIDKPLERTGAGDAFAGAIITALISGEPLDKALLWGPINSSGVIRQIGAQAGLLDQKALTQLLAKAPTSYQIKSL